MMTGSCLYAVYMQMLPTIEEEPESDNDSSSDHHNSSTLDDSDNEDNYIGDPKDNHEGDPEFADIPYSGPDDTDVLSSEVRLSKTKGAHTSTTLCT